MDLKTSFAVLGVDPEADEARVKRAFKAQVRRWHPDQFSAGSETKLAAEEHLKQINIAYTRVKAHLAARRPDPTAAEKATPVDPDEGGVDRHETTGQASKTRSWVDHLFGALNAFAGKRDGQPPRSPATEGHANCRKTFEQVLDEMAGAAIFPRPKPQPLKPDARRPHVYGRQRRHGAGVGAVGATESPGPVKPVGRIRGIGRSR
ncbi:J domain-containing protein [Desulfosarcina sp.]|uniref:J domain-containing protein n=1 Tax=Desulfosarcina sp. TaxID=2027861 RepID=UPI0039709D3D